MPRLTANPIVKIGEGICVTALLLLLALVERTHYQLLIQLETGLTLDFVETVPTMAGAGEFFRVLTWQDDVFLLAPALIFILALLFARTWQRIDKYVFLCLLAVVLSAQLAGPQTLPPAIASNPVAYFMRDVIQDWMDELVQKTDYYARLKDLPGVDQMNSIRLVDPAFANPRTPRPPSRREPALTADGRPWNILFFVLESTGADYVFDTSLSNKTPMPFLQKMTGEGLCLGNHYSSANNTARAAFSIFTGLYDSTSRKIFSMEENASIPTLNNYLPAEYDFF